MKIFYQRAQPEWVKYCFHHQKVRFISSSRCVIFFPLHRLALACQEWSTSNFSCSLTRNITSHSMKNLAFHSLLRCKMIVLPTLTTLSYKFLFRKVGRMYVLNLGVKGLNRVTAANGGKWYPHWWGYVKYATWVPDVYGHARYISQ